MLGKVEIWWCSIPSAIMLSSFIGNTSFLKMSYQTMSCTENSLSGLYPGNSKKLRNFSRSVLLHKIKEHHLVILVRQVTKRIFYFIGTDFADNFIFCLFG